MKRFGKERVLLPLLFLSKVPSFIVKLQLCHRCCRKLNFSTSCWRKEARGMEPQGVKTWPIWGEQDAKLIEYYSILIYTTYIYILQYIISNHMMFIAIELYIPEEWIICMPLHVRKRCGREYQAAGCWFTSASVPCEISRVSRILRPNIDGLCLSHLLGWSTK